MKYLLPIAIILVLTALLASCCLLKVPETPTPEVIGGARDEHGCLVAAGYSYSDTVGACLREFELTPDITAAAALAVAEVGPGYALTVVSWNAYEEPGAYDIMLERGEERILQTVYIRGGVVVSPNQVDQDQANQEFE